MNIYKTVVAIVILHVTGFTFGQEVKTFPETDWQITENKEGVIFSTRRGNCEIFQGKKPLYYSFLRIENTGSEPKKLSFNYGLAFEEGCSGCDDDSESHVEITIGPNETLEGNCLFSNHLLTRLIVNPNLAGGWKFKSEMLTNLQINKQ
jgi:hypothetical protein